MIMAGLLPAALFGLVAMTTSFHDGSPGSDSPGEGSGPARADSLLLVLNKEDNEAALVDPATYEVTAKILTGDRPHEAAISPDGRLAYATNYGAQVPGRSVSVLDLAERAVRATWEPPDCIRPHGIALSRDGAWLWLTCEGSQAVLELDARTGAVANRWTTGQEGSHMLAPTPDGTKLYVANVGSGTVTAIHRPSGRTATIATGPGSEGINVSPDGREVWVGSNGAHTIAVIDVAADSVVARFDAGGRVPIRVRFTPDGSQVWVSNAESNAVSVFDARSRRLLGTVAVGAVPVGILVTPDNRLAFVANTNANQVTVVDVKQRRVTRSFTTGTEPDGMAWWEK